MMIRIRDIASSTFGTEVSTPLIYSDGLSRYRDFQFGTTLSEIAERGHLKMSEARTIHQRPAVIQELQWQARSFLGSLSRADSVRNILFSFCNGELFRIVVTYDPDRTEGMTEEDLIEAISEEYGTAARPAAEIILTTTHLYNEGEKLILDRSEEVIARWENSQFAFNLFQYSSQNTFGLVAYSKRLDALAQSAMAEAIRLDEQEAPQRGRSVPSMRRPGERTNRPFALKPELESGEAKSVTRPLGCNQKLIFRGKYALDNLRWTR
jgi:hypothetical protein